MDDRRAAELRCRDYWRREMLGRRVPRPGEGAWEDGIRVPVQFWEIHAKVTLDDIQLEGEYPNTQLVVVFHQMQHPVRGYSWRHPVWIDGTVPSEPGMGDTGDIWVPFLEWLDLRFRPWAARRSPPKAAG
jgi:hypothetical protein